MFLQKPATNDSPEYTTVSHRGGEYWPEKAANI